MSADATPTGAAASSGADPAVVAPIGIIAGTGFYALDALEDARAEVVETAYGAAAVTRGRWHGLPVVFLTRHGTGHSVPPHMINYRANIRALADLGVRDVFAVTVTGGIDPSLPPGALVCPDDFLDFTRARVGTFFDGTTPEGVVHTDVTHPYHRELRAEILAAAARRGTAVRDGGAYACFEGPRFESPAEVRLAALAGGVVAGMTGVPEVTLAAELGLRYAALSLVVNPAAGVGAPDEIISHEEIGELITQIGKVVVDVLDEVVRARAAGSSGGAVS